MYSCSLSFLVKITNIISAHILFAMTCHLVNPDTLGVEMIELLNSHTPHEFHESKMDHNSLFYFSVYLLILIIIFLFSQLLSTSSTELYTKFLPAHLLGFTLYSNFSQNNNVSLHKVYALKNMLSCTLISFPF